MNKFLESMKTVPDYIMELAEKTNSDLSKYGKETEVTNSNPESVRLDLSLAYSPQKPESNVIRTWYSHCDDHEPPYLLYGEMDHRTLDCSAPYTLCLDWYVLNSDGDPVWIDTSEAVKIEQIFDLTPKFWKELQRSLHSSVKNNYFVYAPDNASNWGIHEIYFDEWFTRLTTDSWNVFDMCLFDSLFSVYSFGQFVDIIDYNSLRRLKNLKRNSHGGDTFNYSSMVKLKDDPNGTQVINLRKCRQFNLYYGRFIFNHLI